MPIKKAPPPKKFDSSNTNVRTGKAKPAPKPQAPAAKPTVSSGGSSFHEAHPPVQMKATPPPTATNTLREAITATQRRERDAGT